MAAEFISLGDMIMARCGKIFDGGKLECLKRNQSKCQFVYHPFILSLICKWGSFVNSPLKYDGNLILIWRVGLRIIRR